METGSFRVFQLDIKFFPTAAWKPSCHDGGDITHLIARLLSAWEHIRTEIQDDKRARCGSKMNLRQVGWLVHGFLGPRPQGSFRNYSRFFFRGKSPIYYHGILMEEFLKFTMLAVWVGFIS